MKILRDGATHTVKDLEVAALLEGDFESSYTAGDNTKVVATDTIKNTINVLAKQHLGEEIERFGVAIGETFSGRYPQVRQAHSRDLGTKLAPARGRRGTASAFLHERRRMRRMFTRVVASREAQTVQSGIRDLVILKSTGSGFEGYPRDEFTTLPRNGRPDPGDVIQRDLDFRQLPANCRAANEAMLECDAESVRGKLQSVRADHFVSDGRSRAGRLPGNFDARLAMPNKHCLLIDLSPFGLENKNEVFVPIDEPHGADRRRP